MAGNPFDETIAQLDAPAAPSAPAASSNPYDATVAAVGGESETRMRRSIAETADQSPDTAAETRRLSLKLGIPPAVIGRNLPQYQKEDQLAKPYKAMQSETPKLASWLEAPENAAVAKDDLENLGFLEWLVTAPQRAFASTMNQQNYSGLRYQSMFRELTQAEHDQLESYRYQQQADSALGAGKSWFKGAITGTASFIANQVPVLKYGAGFAAAGAAAGSVVPGVGTVAGAGIGFHAGIIGGVLKSTFEQESAGAYDEYIGFKDELGRPLDPAVAKIAALVTGAINAPIEAGAQEFLLKSIPGIGKLSSVGVRSAVMTALKNPTVRAALFDAAKSYAGTLAAETGQEVAQRGITILSGEIAKALTGQGGKARTAGDITQDLISEGASALQSFALGVLPGPMIAAVHGTYQAKAAQQNAQIFTALGEGMTQSKTAQRMPEAAQAFLEHATKGGPVEKIYAPVETWQTYWQDKGIDPAQVAAEVTGSRDAYERAVQTGEDLEIPTARYATKLAATEHNTFFAQELRLKPGEMNAREAEAYLEQLQTEQAAASAKPAQPPSQTEQIRSTLTGQLEAAGVPATTADSYANLYESVFANLGERAGIAPAALFDRYGLQVSREGLTTALGDAVSPSGKQPEAQGHFEQMTAPLTAEEVQGLERRQVQVAAPGGQERRQERPASLDPNAPENQQLDTTKLGIGAAATQMIAADPTLVKRAATMRLEALLKGRHNKGQKDAAAEADTTPATAEFLAYGPDGALFNVKGGPSNGSTHNAAGLEHLGITVPDAPADTGERLNGDQLRQRILDARAAAGDTSKANDTGAKATGAQASRGGGASFRSITASTPLGRESAKQRDARRTEHYNDVFATVLDAATKLDPAVDATALRKEFDDRIAFLEAGEEEFIASGHDPLDLLRAIAKAGGISLAAESGTAHKLAGYSGEIKWLRDSHALGPFGSYAGVRGVFRARDTRGGSGMARTGLSLDDMLTSITQEQRFQHLETIDDLLNALGDISRMENVDRGGTFYGGDELQRRAGVNPDVKWWIGEQGFNQVAFHGSPHKFEHFSMQAIGSGEGAQAYGWGLYFASQRETAEYYRDALSKVVPAFDGVATKTTAETFAHDILSKYQDKSLALQVAQTYINGGIFKGDNAESAKAELFAAIEANADKTANTARQGALYKVEIPDDADYLDWDRPASKQSPKVQAALKALGVTWQEFKPKSIPQFLRWFETKTANALWQEDVGIREEMRRAFHMAEAGDVDGLSRWQEKHQGLFSKGTIDPTGETIYRELHQVYSRTIKRPTAYEEQKAGLEMTSKALNAKGVAGVRYLDGFSRVNPNDEGSSNYVVFDDQLVRVQEFFQAGIDRAEQLEMLATDEAMGVEFPEDAPSHFPDGSAAIVCTNCAQQIIKLAGGKGEIYGWEDGTNPTSVVAGPEQGAHADEGQGHDFAVIDGRYLVDAWGKNVEGSLPRAVFDLEDPAQRAEVRHYFGDPSTWLRMKSLEDGGWTKAHPKQLDDTTDAGAQPRLPAAGMVRDVENATPTMDAPFALKSETSKRKGKQSSLFQEKRGAIRFGADRQMNIALFANADLSTFLHESGHFFLEVLRDLAAQPGANDTIKADLAIINGAFFTDADNTAGHERFARAFEAYLMKGESPSLALRTTFARFRAWLTGVYRAVKNLNVKLDDRITGVMDRLVATDAAIADAQAAGEMAPIFLDAKTAGMSDREFSLYRRTVEDASREAQTALQAKLLAEVQREQSSAWKTRRLEIRADVEREVWQRPEFIALAAIQRGTFGNGDPLEPGKPPAPMKLSRKAIVDEFGKGRLRTLPRPIIYTDEAGGLRPSVAAEMFGYSSGDALLTALAKAGNMTRAIDTETDKRMIAEHGSILLDGSLPERAQAAAANETRDAVVRAEMRALINLKRLVAPHVVEANRQAQKERSYERRWFEAEAKLKIAIAEGRKQVEIDELQNEVDNLKRKAAGGPALITAAIPRAETIATAAKNRIAGTRIRDLKPELFWAAARKAQRTAVEAAAKQDFDAAILAQQQQLFNLALYREAERALDDADARARQAKDLNRPAARARLAKAGESYLAQVDGILDRYEFAAITGKQLAKRGELRRWVAAMEAENLPIELSDELLDDSRRINYSELTYDELVGVTDGLQQIVHLARLTLRRLQAQKEEDYADTRDGIVTGVESHGVKREVKLELLPKDKPARVVGEWFASHTKLATFVAQLDGYIDGGPVWDAFMRPINEAATKQQTMHEAAAIAMGKILKDHYTGRELSHLHDQLFIPAIGASLSREARLAVALNWGNEGNRQRLMESVRHWNTSQVQAILDTLDARDLRFVQESLDYINTYWPEIEAKQKRVFGIAPEKVPAASWTHTQHGEQKGGYYPIAYDGRLSVRQGNIIDADAAGLQKHANYAYATTKRGYTKAREEKVNAPVRLELSVMYEHLEGVIHDLSHHEMLIDVGRLLGDRKVQQAIASRVGDIGYRQMRGALLDIALGLRHSSTVQDRAINWVKNGTTIAGLAWNAWTASQQWLGIFNGAARIGPKWVALGVSRMFRDASSMEWSARWVSSKSEMMRLRGDTMNREIADLRATLQRSGSWFDNALRTVTRDKLEQEDITSSYLWLIEKTQQLADLPVWIGGYEKAMAAGETEARAIALADQGVLDSQSGGQIKDLAQVQRGGPFFRLFTAFYSYGNLIFNQTSRTVGQTNFRRVGSVGQMLGNLALIYVAPAAITVAMATAFGKEDPKDPEGFVALMGREMLATAMNTMVLLRELGGATQLLYAKATGVKAAASARGYEGPTGLRVFSGIYNLAQQGAQGTLDRGLLRATEDVAGVLFHLPLAQVQRSIDGFVALDEGRTHNPAALIFGAPPKKASGQ